MKREEHSPPQASDKLRGEPELPGDVEAATHLTDERGLHNDRWIAPAKFSAWLGKRLAGRTAGLGVRVGFRPDGTLIIDYRSDARYARHYLLVGREKGGGLASDLGELREHPSSTLKVLPSLLHYTQQVLHRLFAGQPPVWLRRAEERSVLGWGPGLLEECCSDLLIPGLTHWGSQWYEGSSFDNDTAYLVFRGLKDFVLFLSREAPDSPEKLVGSYGGLFLSTDDPSLKLDPFVNYIGYVLSIRLPSNPEILHHDPFIGDRAQDGVPYSEDGFLMCVEASFALFFEGPTMLFAEGDIAVVVHGERECATCFRALPGPTEEYAEDQWSLMVEKDRLRHYRFTDFSSADIATGDGRDGASLLVRQIAADKPDIILLINACSGVIMGETCEAIFAEAFGEALPDAILIPCNVTLTTDTEQFVRQWERLLRASRVRSPSIIPGHVNLVGYGSRNGQTVKGLSELLSDIGITDVQYIIPSFDSRRIAAAAAAELTVVYPYSRITMAFSEAQQHLLGPTLDLAAPWGVEYTDRWLSAISSARGNGELTLEQLEDLRLRHLPTDWYTLKERAKAHRIGFIMSLSYMVEKGSHIRYGLPVVEFLREMGFGVDLVVMPPRGRSFAPVSRFTLERWSVTPEGDDRVRLIQGHPGQSLGELLSSSAAVVFYSEFKADERILRVGKQPFSREDLHMGYAGAYTNLVTLLRLCELPFNRLQAGVLGRGAPNE